MSYIRVELGGKERGLKFNQLALEIMISLAGQVATQNVYAMFYGGLRGNSYVKQEEPDYTLEDVSDWVDEMYAQKKFDVIAEVEKKLTETQLYKSLIPEEREKPKKKKA